MSAAAVATAGILGFLVLAGVCLAVALRLPRGRQFLSMVFFLGFTAFGVAALFSLIFFGKERA
jgi:hypothetical protein